MNSPAAAPVFRRLLPVVLAAMLGAAMIHGARSALHERITSGRMRSELQPVLEVMPLAFDNDLLADRMVIDGLDQDAPAGVFRARHGGRAVGVVVMPVAARGYNGIVDLAVGIAYDGTLTGVRVVRHRETPGLGDRVHQHNSHWLDQLPGRSLNNTPDAAWAVQPDGGAFDGISGATITPRGILRAVRGTLSRYARDPESFYSDAAGQ